MTPAPTAVVRAWARANGYTVSDRGRIPLEVQAAYDAAHAQPPEPVHAEPQEPLPAEPQQPWPVQQRPWPVQPGPQQWGQPQWGQPQGAPPWPAPTDQDRDGFAVPALVLGILPCVSPLGVVFGIVALSRIAGTAKKGRNMAIAGIVCGVLWVVGFIAAGIIGVALEQPDRDQNGSVTAEGDVGVTKLQVGDCIEAVPTTLVRTVHVVPCTQPHEGEVFATFTLAGTTFPGTSQVARFASGGCQTRVSAYAGEAAPDRYEVLYFAPTSEFWAEGEHDVTCLFGGPDGTTLTGSLRVA